MEKYQFDVLIIGGGVAGLSAALNLDERLGVAIVTKGKIRQSSTWMAQGGIAVALGPDDSTELHFADTVKVGLGECKEEAVRILVDEAPAAVDFLRAIGTEFDTGDGRILLAREGGHSRARVIHAGDTTGSTVAASLGKEASRRRNIVLFDDCFALDLLRHDDTIVGAVVARMSTGERVVFSARATLLAAGGMGQIYTETTNPLGATGDGFAMAHRAGAEMLGMEFVQFHPTSLWSRENPRFLISEAVRGEGAILVDDTGRHLMESVHPLGDLAPRDVASFEIARIMREHGIDHVFLDCRHLGGEFLSGRFPRIYGECLRHGYDMGKDLVPVSPVAHYMIGGVKTDLDCVTALRGLYACGEVAYTGVHGANRLASNSLLEGLVFGRRFAFAMNKGGLPAGEQGMNGKAAVPATAPGATVLADAQAGVMRERLRAIVSGSAGVIRDGDGLRAGIAELRALRDELAEYELDSVAGWELLNMTDVGGMVLEAALRRRHSLGAHRRADD